VQTFTLPYAPQTEYSEVEPGLKILSSLGVTTEPYTRQLAPFGQDGQHSPGFTMLSAHGNASWQCFVSSRQAL